MTDDKIDLEALDVEAPELWPDEIQRLRMWRRRRQLGPAATAEERAAGIALGQKLVALIAGMPTLGRGGEMKDKKGVVRYTFVEADAVTDLLRPRLAAIGLLIVPTLESATLTPVNDEEDAVRATVKLYANVIDVDSGEVMTVTWWGEAADWGDKSIQKAITSAWKYLRMKLFQLSGTGDPDSEDPMDPEDERPRRRRQTPAQQTGETAAPVAVGTEDRAQTLADLISKFELVGATGQNADGSPKYKRGVEKWFPAKVEAKLKAAAKAGTTPIAKMTAEQWAAGLAEMRRELNEQHAKWCGATCEHLDDVAAVEDRLPDPVGAVEDDGSAENQRGLAAAEVDDSAAGEQINEPLTPDEAAQLDAAFPAEDK